jgi:transcriptional regulator with XRE-family HTH domain
VATESNAAKFFAYYVDRSELNQREIAEAAGYRAPNIISMFKTGTTRIPVEKIPVLSRALHIDPKRFLREVMEEYQPTIWVVLQSIMGGHTTANEDAFLKQLRERVDDDHIVLRTSKQHAAFDSLVEALNESNRVSAA